MYKIVCFYIDENTLLNSSDIFLENDLFQIFYVYIFYLEQPCMSQLQNILAHIIIYFDKK